MRSGEGWPPAARVMRRVAADAASDRAAPATAAEEDDQRQQGDEEQQRVHRNTPGQRNNQQDYYECYEHWVLLSLRVIPTGPVTKQMRSNIAWLPAAALSRGATGAPVERSRMLGHQPVEEALRVRLGTGACRSRAEHAWARRCVSHALGNRAARGGFEGLVCLGREGGHGWSPGSGVEVWGPLRLRPAPDQDVKLCWESPNNRCHPGGGDRPIRPDRPFGSLSDRTSSREEPDDRRAFAPVLARSQYGDGGEVL